MSQLSSEEQIRYSRQIMIRRIGEGGQERLKRARILIAGLGGLGSLSAYYLAAAGVGYLKIVDRDRVGLENLNRQILHRTQDIGRPKSESALEKLRALNPLCRIDAVTEEIDENSVMQLVGDCDLIVDALDNFEARTHLNRASLSRKIPFIHGGVDGFSGMVTTFLPGKTPCLECLFPQARFPKEKVGAIGPVPGMISSIQSLEAIKLVLGMEGLLTNTLLHINGLTMSIKRIGLEKDPDCGRCGAAGKESKHE
ncbi:MAG: HesA/MoeB/ThiF family protein [Pseudomonadota bacterium]